MVFSVYEIDDFIAPVNKLEMRSKIFVLTDCVEPSFYAGKAIAIAAVIDRETEEMLITTRLSHVTIRLVSDASSFIPFSRFPSTVQLHFRAIYQ